MKRYKQSKIEVPRFNEKNGFYTTESRSRLMSKIKSCGTKNEMKLRKALWNAGMRYRKNLKSLPGTPDIVLLKYKIVIFIDGEFWHGYNWAQKKERIKSNKEFWIPKIERNIERDKQNVEILRNLGWKVLRFWEKELNKRFDYCMDIIFQNISEVTTKKLK